ncbi:hypothetical protein ACPF8X_09645 [Streptomyces sp. G35A]
MSAEAMRSSPAARRPTAVVVGAGASGLFAAAWPLAVGRDAFHPGAAGIPPSTVERLLARYVGRAVATGARNPRAMAALLDVMSPGKPAARLFTPHMLIPMLLGPRQPRLQGPPLAEAERKAVVS